MLTLHDNNEYIVCISPIYRAVQIVGQQVEGTGLGLGLNRWEKIKNEGKDGQSRWVNKRWITIHLLLDKGKEQELKYKVSPLCNFHLLQSYLKQKFI